MSLCPIQARTGSCVRAAGRVENRFMRVPEVEYARSGGVSIAYQVVGEGPVDLVFVPELSNLLWYWQHPLPDFRDARSPT